MAIKKRKISTQDLAPGMYVAEVDRPWREADVLFQGFYVETLEEIDDLREKFSYVYIDVGRKSPGEDAESDDETGYTEELTELCDPPKRDNVYSDTVTVEEELSIAKDIQRHALATVTEVMQQVRVGKTLKLAIIEDVVLSMLESILRNPDAFTWLGQIKHKDGYGYSHAIDSCALAITFGRHLGLSRGSLASLGTGALLFDVGKIKLPDGLLSKPGKLSPAEFQVIRKHVDLGAVIVSGMHGTSTDAVDMVKTHHERFDGKGYPYEMSGTSIPMFGRIAAIVDSYDAMTSDRSYKKAITPHQALRVLYSECNKAFQEELVEQFIQCLGVYPTGSLVELTSGEVGIVIAQNRMRRLRPKIMLILDSNKVALKGFETIDLDREDTVRRLEISKSIDPGSYGIDPGEYYIGR